MVEWQAGGGVVMAEKNRPSLKTMNREQLLQEWRDHNIFFAGCGCCYRTTGAHVETLNFCGGCEVKERLTRLESSNG